MIRHYTGKGNLQLKADHWGEPGAQPILLSHGGGQTRHAWKGTGQALADAGFHAIALDLRGHGESDWSPEKDYSTSAFAEDLCRVIDTLEQPPALVGASLGGMASMLVSGLFAPDKVSALVLVDIALHNEPKGVERIVNFMSGNPDGFATLDEAAEAIAGYTGHRKRERNPEGLMKNLRERNGRYYWHWDPDFMDRAPGHVEKREQQMNDAANNLKVPVLLVRGGLSDIVSEESARLFQERIPHAEYVNVSGASHMVAGDRNDIFTRAVLDFLQKIYN
ncbi:MAG: alpha/beta hydrolase [Pseudomonadota bacterium]